MQSSSRGTGFQHKEILRSELLGRPLEQGLEAEILRLPTLRASCGAWPTNATRNLKTQEDSKESIWHWLFSYSLSKVKVKGKYDANTPKMRELKQDRPTSLETRKIGCGVGFELTTFRLGYRYRLAPAKSAWTARSLSFHGCGPIRATDTTKSMRINYVRGGLGGRLLAAFGPSWAARFKRL